MFDYLNTILLRLIIGTYRDATDIYIILFKEFATVINTLLIYIISYQILIFDHINISIVFLLNTMRS